MDATIAPFRCAFEPDTLSNMEATWYSAGAPWGGDGTYGVHPLAKMPAITTPLRGTFDWLPPSPYGGLAYRDRVEYEEVEAPTGLSPEEALLAAIMGPPPKRKPTRPGWDGLDALAAEASSLGLVVPREMIVFLSSPELFTRVPTCTACYLDLSQLVPGPTRRTRLIRFMNDQQCSVLWYVQLEPGGSHSVLAAGARWKKRQPRTPRTLEDEMTPQGFTRCAASFEELIHRFWIENTIWFAEHARPPKQLSAEQRAYAKAARKALAP